MSDPSGYYFIKPCTKAEYSFYESARCHPDFFSIMPEFHGDVKLTLPDELPAGISGAISADGELKTDAKEIEKTIAQQVSAVLEQATQAPIEEWVPGKNRKIKADTNLALKNQAFGFKKPNILDAKLGKQLCGDYAPPAKIAKMQATSDRTTHRTHGFRIAGMRVYHGGDDESEWDEDGYRVYGKTFGEETIGSHNIVDGLRSFVFNEKAGIDEELGKAVCAAFIRELEEIERVLETHEIRMFSSSLLFVFEGDGDALLDAIEQNNEMVEQHEFREKRSRTPLRMDSGIAMDDDDSDDDEFDDEGLPPIFNLKLIDFAHATWTPGEKCDENILMGVRSLKKLFTEMAE